MAQILGVLAGVGILGAALATPSRPPAPEEQEGLLECFQVAQPVLGPEGLTPSWGRETPVGDGQGECDVLLMEHSFGASYGQPFVGDYTPPDCSFTNVLLTLTVLSAGHQFDRLALMYLNNTEIWRTSTAEPTEGGIIWTYRKDVTPFLSLWRKPQKIIFDLGNIIDETYTGAFNTTLTATFFTVDQEEGREAPADLVVPLSAMRAQDDEPSAWHLPETAAAVSISSFPRNARRAVLSVSANGQQAEEFWWNNVPEADVLDFETTVGPLPGLSPFREVQVLLDGQMVGVQWPFPVIFTGGISPSFHRPVVGVQAFDLREAEIDISPWLPVLCDGEEHVFEIRVAGIDDSGEEVAVTNQVGSYWVITGKIFVWVDEDAESVTTGEAPTVNGTDPQGLGIAFTQRELLKTEDGVNETLRYTLEASRQLSVTNNITTQEGEKQVSWTQSLSYINNGTVETLGLDQLSDLVISSRDEALENGSRSYVVISAYPLRVWSALRVGTENPGDFTVNSTMQQALELAVGGKAVFPSGLEAFDDGSAIGRISTVKTGAAFLFRRGDGSGGYGTGYTNQTFTFEGIPSGGGDGVPLYSREISAENDVLVADKETVGEETIDAYSIPAAAAKSRVVEWAGEASVGKGVSEKLAMLTEGRDEAEVDRVLRVLGDVGT